MASGSYQLIWVAQGSGGVTLASLPQTGATTGQAIVWNGTMWAPATVASAASGSVNSLSGDVTTATPDANGNAVATVAQVGGKTASVITSTVNAVSAATSANTASTIVQRDSNGNISVGTITGALTGNAATATNSTYAVTLTGSAGSNPGQSLVWNNSTGWVPANVAKALTGDVTTTAIDGNGNLAATVAQVGGASASNIASTVTFVQQATAANTANTIVERDNNNNINATTFTGGLTGSVNGVTAANSVSGINAANAATNANTASTIVKRDASGNFTAGTITAALAGNATTATTATNLSGSINPSQINSGSATTGQALVWNGSAYAPATISSGGGGITQLTGDVTTPASSSGSTAATVASVGGNSAALITSLLGQVQNASPYSTAGTLTTHDNYGALYTTTGVTVMTGQTVTVNASYSNLTYVASSGSNTITLIANPANTSYKYKFMGIGGTITVNPPTTGTTPTFYYFGGSTTSAINQVNSNNGDAIEFTGIPGTSNYIVSNMAGNWQSGGNPLGVYSALSYPGTTTQVLTGTGNTGGAAFNYAPAAGFLAVVPKTAGFAIAAADAGKLFTSQGATTGYSIQLPTVASVYAACGNQYGWTTYFLASAPSSSVIIKMYPGAGDKIYTQNGNTTVTTGYISTSTSRTSNQIIGLTATAPNRLDGTYGYTFDWGLS